MVEHCGAHPDQRTVLHFAAVQGDAMADGHVVAQDARRFAIERMDAGIVLYVCSVANLDEVHIATDNGIEPNGAVVTHLYVAHYDCTFAEVAVLAESGSRHPLESLYNCHLDYLRFKDLRFL
jgi:hypothetical protein